jgi:hypothetical protein
MRRYAGDPRWVRARYPGTCRSCEAPIARGEHAFYWPRRGAVSCQVCGEVEARRFALEAADEELYGGGRG